MAAGEDPTVFAAKRGQGACQPRHCKRGPEFCINGFGLKAGHPFFKLDRKAIERRFPITNQHGPFLTDV